MVRRVGRQLARRARVSVRRALAPRGPRRLPILLIGLVLIALWQLSFTGAALDSSFRLTASSGLHDESRFVYFLRHLGLFPVASESEPKVDTEAGARALIEEEGHTLFMELGHTIRYGELGKTFTYLPDALFSGSTRNLSVKPAHAGAFITALLLLFSAFWWGRRPLLGGIAVALFGSNPFQLYEVYGNENVFSWNITTALLVLAIHVPLILERRPPRALLFAAPIATGLLLATIRQVRTEPALIGASALLCYLMISSLRWRFRIGIACLFVAAFMLGSSGWSRWFDAKWEEAQRVVADAGGHPFPGAREKHHLIWHPIWCGLGDFGEDKGYRWDDREAAAYALPILERSGADVPDWNPDSYIFEDTFIDPHRKYYQVPYLLPGYTDVIRDKIVADVTADPLWYLGVLAQRAWRVLSDVTPIGVAARRFALRVPVHGLFALGAAAAVLLMLRRRRAALLLFLFLTPLSATALLIFSGRGVTYYGCFHVLPVAVLLAALVKGLRASAPLR